jgi:hypothetical protein
MNERPVARGRPLSAGQADRLSALFEAHADRLYRLARRLVPSADDALDLLQEAFLKAARSLESIPPGLSNEHGWSACSSTFDEIIGARKPSASVTRSTLIMPQPSTMTRKGRF